MQLYTVTVSNSGPRDFKLLNIPESRLDTVQQKYRDLGGTTFAELQGTLQPAARSLITVKSSFGDTTEPKRKAPKAIKVDPKPAAEKVVSSGRGYNRSISVVNIGAQTFHSSCKEASTLMGWNHYTIAGLIKRYPGENVAYKNNWFREATPEEIKAEAFIKRPGDLDNVPV
jgi:hypothetical protein